jgi:hypothetical protein
MRLSIEKIHKKIPSANSTFSKMTSSPVKIKIISRMMVKDVKTKRDISSPLLRLSI